MKKYKFNIDRNDFYAGMSHEEKIKIRKRLIEIAELGMEEVGIAQFGIKGITSGLYIEKVWNYSDDEFSKYLEWVKELIKDKSAPMTGFIK